MKEKVIGGRKNTEEEGGRKRRKEEERGRTMLLDRDSVLLDSWN